MDGSENEQGNEDIEELALAPVAVVHKRRPRALWAVLALVALAAGALVVTSADDDGNQVPGLPVDLAGASRAGGAEAAADSMLAWVTYVPGDDLPSLGGEATAYRLSGEVTEAQVRELADVLDIDGEVVAGPDGTWSVTGAGDGRLDVYVGGGAYWSYTVHGGDCVREADDLVRCSGQGTDCVDTASGPAGCGYSTGASATSNSSVGKPLCEDGAECVDPTTTTYDVACSASDGPAECITGDCAEAGPCPGAAPPPAPCDDTTDGVAADCPTPIDRPEPAPNLSSEDEARQIALDVVATGTGADVDGARVTAESGYDWFVTVEPVVDGTPSGLVAYVEVGSGGQVVSGNGFFGQPEALGDYPLLDTRAVIDRANAQSGSRSGIEPAIARDDSVSSTTGGTDTGGTDVGTTADPDASVATAVDPCLPPPDGASDGCGGTTGCGGDGCAEATTTIPCKVQADGSEICEFNCVGAEPGEDVAVGAPESADCPPQPPDPGVDPDPDPLPEPQPLEIVLVDAEPSLVLLPANDGTPSAYLVPAYRFTAEDGSTIDLPAVTDDALASSNTTETTAPIEPGPVPVPEPQPCEVLEEGGSSGTTQTIQTCPAPNEDPTRLPPGEEPVVGVGYYVDAEVMDGHCTWLVVTLGDQVWWTPGYYQDDLYGWSQPTEGGTFTIAEDGTAEFVGDADRKKVATLVPWDGEGERPLCE